MANSEDSAEMSPNMALHQGLHYLLKQENYQRKKGKEKELAGVTTKTIFDSL